MRSGAIAYLGGILLLLQLPELPDVSWCLLLLPLIPLVLLADRLRIIAVFLCAFLLSLWHANSIVSRTIPVQFEGLDLSAIGVISSLPKQTLSGNRFTFTIENLSAGGLAVPLTGKVQLSWYNGVPELHSGERWQLMIRLKHPHGLANPGSFDYEAWLFQNRILATGYVRNAETNRLLGPAGGQYSLQSRRHDLATALEQVLQGQPYAGLIMALAIGERYLIPDDQWDVLIQTGTNHLVAISGLHIGMVAGLGFILMRRLWASVPWLALRWPAQSAAAISGLVLALIYAALAGFSIPTQRALIMVAIALLAILLQRHQRPTQVLAVALISVLTFDPLAVLSAGFWLSFTAVAIILMGMNHRLSPSNRWAGWWWRWGRLHILVSIGLIPVLLILFQRLPLMSPLANIIAVPWVSLLVVPLVLLGTLFLPMAGGGLAQALLHLANLSLAALWPLLSAIASLDLAQWTQHVPLGWTVLPALLGTALLLLPRGVPGRGLGLVWMAPALLVTPAGPGYGSIYFTLMDVGQGLAAVVRTQTHVLVYDTGPRFSADFDAGRAVLVPFLRGQGITEIDRLIIGHGDNDHIGGADSLQRQMTINQVASSVPDKIHWGRAEACRDQQHWRWDGVDFDLLHPTAAQAWQGNNASCVLRISNGDHKMLLSGDIEAFAEQRLIAIHAAYLDTDILVAPHHGSKTSSTLAFIKAVKPAFVLFPVGYHNRYHLPQSEVVQRYTDQGSHILRTDFDGAISVQAAAGQEIRVFRYRDQAGRFWVRHIPFH
jgi:competence protein ComEC